MAAPGAAPTQIKAKVITYGCQMNFRDSEMLKGVLLRNQYSLTEDLEEAGLVLVNTCSVRAHAEHRVLSLLGVLREWKEQGPGRRIGVCGCMSERLGGIFLKHAPHLDFVLGVRQLEGLDRLLKTPRPATGEEGPLVLTGAREGSNGDAHVDGPRDHPFKAYVTVMEGCNLACTYCIVPSLRGRQRSRPPGQVVREAEDLAREGYKEVTLLGQTVNAYGMDLDPPVGLAELLERLDGVPGIERFRLMSPHPGFATEKFFRKVRGLSRVCGHFHLPVQSGSNKVLKAMQRGYTREEFLEKVKMIRGIFPDGAVSTDLIVGFPGETDEDMSATLDLVAAAELDSAYTFKYSPRPGTAAYALGDTVAEELKKERLELANQAVARTALTRNQGLLGSTEEVLAEEAQPSRRRLMGRTRTNKEIVFPGDPSLIGRTLRVRVTGAFAWSLEGVLAEQG